MIHYVSIFLCKGFETSLTWLSYHLFILQGAVLCTLHQRMALWYATTLDRTRLAKFNVNKAMTLSSLLPFFITALEEIGTCSQLVFTIQSFHGQTAQVSAMNFSYHRICCYEPWDYTFALGVLEELITEGLISYGAFNRNTKKCFETSYSNADQNASLIFTVFFFFFQFQNFIINRIRFNTS